MIAFPSMLVKPAKAAGMETPLDPGTWEDEKDNFPHFFVFCAVQLGARMPSPNSHWHNAEVIAQISDEEILTVTLEDLIARGLSI